VKRVSMGGGLQRAALTQARRVAAEVLETGSYDGFLADTISHAELSTLLRQNG
jgi:2-methylisocitrate lyase-like PEP mutase family enzyme